MPIAAPHEINTFLKQYRKLMFQPNKFHFVPRTFYGITNLGLNIPDAKQIIKNLNTFNMTEGPLLTIMKTEQMYGNLVNYSKVD